MWTKETFKAFIIQHLWKKNDAELLDALDTLILMAQAKLERKMTINRREVIADLSFTTPVAALPVDFRQIVAVFDDQLGKYDNVTAARYADLFVANRNGQICPAYTLSGRQIHIIGPETIDPARVVKMVYRANLPVFPSDADVDPIPNWVAEEFLDVYTYTVLAQTAPYLREDERVAMWIQLSEAGINDIVEEDRFNIEYGSPLQMATRPHY